MATDVDAQHRDYTKNVGLWKKCRTVIEGEEAVKEAGREYLPSLQDQESSKYDAYKMRAMFYEASGRTLQGLVGALHHKPPIMVGPNGKQDDKALEFFDALVPEHMPFKSYLRDITEEVLSVSRIGILVEVPDTVGPSGAANPYLCSYCAEDVINWRSEFDNGKEYLTLVVIKEEDPVASQFKVEYVPQWRVLELVQGVYTQTIYKYDKDKKQFYIVKGPIVPTKRGVPLDHIPFYFINSGGTNAYVYRPPLLPLVNVNLSHYRNSADLEHGRHFTGLPTPWVAGFGTDEKLFIGSEKAWVSNKTDAKAGFLEFTGAGLTALEKALSSKEGLMAILGARLLEAPKNVAESADNQLIKRSSENSITANVAETISEGMTQICREAADWMGLEKDKVSVTVQREYLDMPADPALLAEFMKALQAGAISYTTYFTNLKKMRIIPDAHDEETELDKIDSGKFGALGMMPIMPGAPVPGAPKTAVPPAAKPPAVKKPAAPAEDE